MLLPGAGNARFQDDWKYANSPGESVNVHKKDVSDTEFENCSGIMVLKLDLVREVVRCFKTQACRAIVLYDENQHAIV